MLDRKPCYRRTVLKEERLYKSLFQILTLLKDPEDSWTKAVSKIAEDVVHRIFDHIPNESPQHSVSFAQILSSWIHTSMAENEEDDREIMLAWHKK